MIEEITAALSPMVALWVMAMVVFAAIEAATVGLVSIWFAGGALAALIAAGLGAPVWLQIVLFLAVSFVMLALLAPFVKKVVRPHQVPTNADRHIGQQALVTEDIDNLQETGAIRMDGVTWTACSESGANIPAGTVITVRRIAGAKAYVSPAEEAGA